VLADEVFTWLSELPEWQRDLARRLTTQVELDDDEYGEALRMVKAQFGVPVDSPALEPCPIRREDLVSTSGVTPARLVALSLRGVGMIRDGELLRFEPGSLTIAYGQNATGKSTYVGALKVLCRTVDRGSRVRGNIYDVDGASAPRVATIEVASDGTQSEVRVNLDGTGRAAIPGMSVFDAACAELYVGAQSTVEYLPAELRLLARLASLQARMRHDLDSERQSLRSAAPPLDAYPASTVVGRGLRKVSGGDGDPDVATLAAGADGDGGRVIALRALVTAAAASTALADAAAATREAAEARELACALADLADRVAEPAVAQLRRAAQDDQDARVAVGLAAEQMSGALPGIGSEPWRLMWESARAFVESGGDQFPPEDGGMCPLCLQSVVAESASRMAHFEAHVTSDVQARSEVASASLAEALAACEPERAQECRTPFLAALRDVEPALALQIETLIQTVSGHLATMQTKPKEAAGASVDHQTVRTALERWAETRESHALGLLSTEDPESLLQVSAELAELEARQRLSEELAVFDAWRAKLKRAVSIDAAHTALATNRITTAQGDLTQREVSKALDAALSEELKKLACGHIPVQLTARTQVAETTVRLSLLASQPAAVQEILSEGERRALALSFFLAELTVLNDSGGIVVDDPVSSLDDDRRQYIARRLVSETARRQVIVFTHDLPFVFELRSAAKTAGVPVHVQHVWRHGAEVGRVDGQPPFSTMNLRQRVHHLTAEVQELRKGPSPATEDEAWKQAIGFYTRLRKSWERAVEERLFAGVVERFERNVRTQSLKDVQVTPDLIARVDAGMSRASLFVHEDAFAAPAPLPSFDDMEADLLAIREFERQTKPTS
jgi:energy-coupling factor transporter ATP-binding protein EcfA2